MPAQNLTYLQIVNAVLARLRRASVATVTETTYSTMIGVMVNTIKSEIEDAAYWYALRNTYEITTVAGTMNYTFTDAGRGAVILSGYNYTTGQKMRSSTNREMDARFFGIGSGSVQTGSPTDYLLNGYDANYDAKIDVWPVPAAEETLKFNLYVPQDDLSDGSDVPRIPINVLIEGAFARAIGERGSDNGQTAELQDKIYQNLLASAVARELATDDTEMDWEPV
jgi:hypothetical protein